ncbi:MAG: YjgP/YjgQ family permease [Elusimicrobia bacterium]|nr:YjgP/YjgQ family permease [Elusimicrobiota bacterium]
MKKINSYCISSFLPAFFFSFILFSIFLFWGVFLEKISMTSKGGASFYDILRLAAAQTPSLIPLIIPISAMTGAFFSFRKMMNTGEWKAFQCAGWAPFDMVKPVLYVSVFIGIGHFLFSEYVSSSSLLKYKEIYNLEIKRKKRSEYEKVKFPVFKKDDNFFYAASYDSYQKKFSDFYCVTLKNGEPVYSISAKSASFDDYLGKWILEEAKEFQKDKKNPNYSFFEKKFFSCLPFPKDLVFKTREPETENFFSLYKRIEKLKELGLKRKKESIAFFGKIASPIASAVMIAAAAAAAMSPLGSAGMAGAGISLLFGFVYWNFSISAQRMAEIELLSPFWGAFMVPMFFSFLVYLVLRRFKAF